MKRFINVDECSVDNEKESVQNAIKTFHSDALMACAAFKNQVNNVTFLLVSEFSVDELCLNFIRRATLKRLLKFFSGIKSAVPDDFQFVHFNFKIETPEESTPCLHCPSVVSTYDG